MKTFINALLLAILLSATQGCATQLISKVAQGDNLTPEQIKAYRESGHDVYGCFQISGPPPSGATVWVIVPKDTKVGFKFGDACHILQ